MDEATIHEIVRSAVKCEQVFICDSLPVLLWGGRRQSVAVVLRTERRGVERLQQGRRRRRRSSCLKCSRTVRSCLIVPNPLGLVSLGTILAISSFGADTEADLQWAQDNCNVGRQGAAEQRQRGDVLDQLGRCTERSAIRMMCAALLRSDGDGDDEQWR